MAEAPRNVSDLVARAAEQAPDHLAFAESASWDGVGRSGASPRSTQTARMPTTWAGRTSWSRRSPTIAHAEGGTPIAATACAKIRGSGFSRPRSSDTPRNSK